MNEFFKVNATKYDSKKNFLVVRPSSLDNPKNNSVIFITNDYISKWHQVLKVSDCIIIWPETVDVPEEVSIRHAVIRHPEPRQRFALFFKENGITYNAELKKYKLVNGAYICEGAVIGRDVKIFPGAYIDSEVVIGNSCFIGSGVKIIGSVWVGNNVIIRENTVIGSDGLTIGRNECGKAITTPQFGGVIIEDNVQIGAMTVIAKGAIDNTIIHSGCRIDNCCFISHNVQLGEDTLMVGETIMFGSSSTGKQAFISGNCTIRENTSIGERAFVGMGSVVVKPVPDGAVVKGNPAK